jgi:hypothetical protein
MRRSLALAGALAGLACNPVTAEQAPDPATLETMQEIVDVLAFVLPLSLSDQRFADPANREAIQESLDLLADNGMRLEAHGADRDASFAFLSSSLAADTRRIRERFAVGRADEARFLLHEMTEDCVACHSRLPDSREHPLGRRLVDDERMASLPLIERVRLEMATRQFDRALLGYETLLASPDQSPADLDLTGHLDAYLELCIRVERDPARARRALEKVAARPELGAPLRMNVAAWIASLRELETRKTDCDPMAEARALIAEARDLSRFPDDRRALVYYVAASSVLHRHLAERASPDLETAETCYLLGLVESRIGRTFWLSQTEFFLDAAIRLAPGARFAEEAYALLEEFVVSGYTGSAGREIPPQVQEHLDELHLLIENARSGKEGDGRRPPRSEAEPSEGGPPPGKEGDGRRPPRSEAKPSEGGPPPG